MSIFLRQNVRRLWSGAGVALLMLLASAPVSAAGSGAISQSYDTSASGISHGELLSLESKGGASVTPADTTNATRLVGVAADKPLVELSHGGTSSVQVVVSGATEALVSDLNGTVKAGDKITASPVSGIGMKATEAAETVGTAQADLSSVSTATRTVAGQDGKNVTIKVGLVPIAVSVAYYSAGSSQSTAASLVPPFLQSLANTLTGHQVSPLRVLIGTAALLLGFATVAIMLYTSIRSGVISIGRNPLAESALRKGLVDVAMAAAGLLAITLAAVYVILLT